MHELTTQLGTIFVTRLVSGNITEIGIPKFKAYLAAKKEREGVEDALEPTRVCSNGG